MNRIDFMSRLSLLLSDLPENERVEALQYYEDYLNDAGVENEEEVLKSLGTPEELAESIREGLKEGSEQQGVFSEKGFFEKGETLENEVARRRAGYGPQNHRTGKEAAKSSSEGADSAAALDRRYRRKERKKKMGGGMIALLIILCIFAAPVVIPVAVALAIVVAVLAFVAVLLAGIFLFTGVICIIAGVLAFAGAVAKLFLYPAGAVLAIGISLLTIGIGILLTLAIGWVIATVFPKAFNGLVDFVGGLFHKKGGKAA